MVPPKYQNVLVVLCTRETGLRKTNTTNILLQRVAEEKAACSELQETHCKLPTSVRSTFLMSFSPDSTKVASTHGDHKIYVCDVKTGRLLHKLEGHPRTPWCLAFHPTSNDILASGCLGGEVRVWHLHGGSEKWGAEHNTVITSLAFHPSDKVLVIATYNQIHFWDWSLPEPFATCRTSSEREKVRFVKFDQLGNRLITGISNLPETNHSFPVASGSGENSHGTRCYRRVSREPLLPPPPTVCTGSTLSQRRHLLTRLMNIYQHETSRSNETRERPVSPTQEDALNRARDYADFLTQTVARRRRRLLRSDAVDRTGPGPILTSPGQSTSAQAIAEPDSRDLGDSDEDVLVRAFWRTFARLRFCCTSLEMRLQQLQHTTESQINVSSSSAVPAVQPRSSSVDMVVEPPNSSRSVSNAVNYLQMTSDYLISTLTRFQTSLQYSSVSGSVAQEQLQQVQWRISEILERLTNVTGYRARLNTLREQIYEVAERSETRGEEQPSVRSSDLAHCLWLIEMSLQLTQHLQRILHADYRLTQLHMNSTPQPSTSSMSSSSSPLPAGNSRQLPGSVTPRNCAICGNQNPGGSSDVLPPDDVERAWDRLRLLVRRELETLTERVRSNLLNEQSSHTNAERLLRALNGVSAEELEQSITDIPLPAENSAGEARASVIVADRSLGSQSASAQAPARTSMPSHSRYQRQSYSAYERPYSDVSDDDESLSGRHLNDHRDLNDLFCALERQYSRNRTRRQSIMHSSAGAVTTTAPSTSSTRTIGATARSRQSSFHVPEVNIVPSSSANDADPLPAHERPRSPPLPTILSGSSDHLLSSWFNAMLDSSGNHLFGVHETVINYSHRVQSWDFSKYEVPEISNAKVNVVVPKCKIHNDASIDISKDGELLVALVPSSGSSIESMMFGIYSLKPKNLGHCLYSWSFDSNAISVSFSPLSQYIVIGLASPRLYLASSEKEAVAQIFKLKFFEDSCVATHVRSLTQQGAGNNHHPGVSLNSVQWLPQPGQGLIYGTNRGCLSICKPVAPMNKKANRNLKVPRSYEVGSFARDMRRRSLNMSQMHRMFSASTQTIERGTQTTGTQTFNSEGSSGSGSR